MVHQIDDPGNDPRKLSQSFVQAGQMLGFYNAELARVLHCHCDDIGRLALGRQSIEPDSLAWQQAALFVRLYQRLYDLSEGDETRMYHWLRKEISGFSATPLLEIVDHDGLSGVLEYLNGCESL